MKAIKRTIIFIAVMIFIQLYATSIPEEKMPEGDYIYSKAFENEVINVILDTITVSKKQAIEMGWEKKFIDEQKGDKVLVEYPKIIEEQIDTTNHQDIRRFKLLNPDGNILLEREYNSRIERFFTSKNKKYIVFSEMPNEYDLRKSSLMYNDDGDKLWEKNDDYYVTRIFDNGNSIGGWGIFYNKRGDEIGKVEGASKDYGDALFYEVFISISIMDNNTVYRIKRWHGNKSLIMVTDSMGNEKWRKELPYKFARPDEYDLDSEIGIIGIYKKLLKITKVYNEKRKKEVNREEWEYGVVNIDKNGEIKWEKILEEKGELKIVIDKGNKKIYLMSPFGILLCLEQDTGEILWKMRTETAPEEFGYGVPYNKERIRFEEIFLSGNDIIIKSSLKKDNSNIIYKINKYNGEVQEKDKYSKEEIILVESIHSIQINQKSERRIYINREK